MHALDGIGILDIACSETSTFVLCNDANLYSVGTGLCGQLGHQDVVHEKLSHFRLVRYGGGDGGGCSAAFRWTVDG